jgi:hypothetical protein
MNPAITLVRFLGTCEHPRYMIGNLEGTIWTGKEWSGDSTDGLLFADLFEASRLCQELQRLQFENAPSVQYFVVPVRIEFRSNGDVTSEELKEWLLTAACIWMSCDSGQVRRRPVWPP